MSAVVLAPAARSEEPRLSISGYDPVAYFTEGNKRLRPNLSRLAVPRRRHSTEAHHRPDGAGCADRPADMHLSGRQRLPRAAGTQQIVHISGIRRNNLAIFASRKAPARAGLVVRKRHGIEDDPAAGDDNYDRRYRRAQPHPPSA
jgi:hypothetical protein